MYRFLATFLGLCFLAGDLLEPHIAAAQSPPSETNLLREAADGDTAPASPFQAAALSEQFAESPTSDDSDGKSSDDKLLTLDPKTKTDLQDRLKALDAAGLPAEDKQKATEFYQQAIEAFDLASQQIEAAKALQTQLDELPEQLLEYQTKLANGPPPYEDVSGETLDQIAQRSKKAEESVAHCKAELAALNAEPKRRSQRMSELPKQIAEAQLKLKQVLEQASGLGKEEAGNVVAGARSAALQQSELACKATLQALEREQRVYQQGAELIKLRQDYYARYVPHKEKRLVQLRGIINQLNKRREVEAQEQAREAAEIAAEVAVVVRPKAVTDLANENKELAERRAQLRGDITAITKQKDFTKNDLQSLKDQHEAAQKQVSLDELSSLSGRILRDQQAKLPNLRTLRRQNLRHEAERSDVLLMIYELNDKRSTLANLDDLTEGFASSAEPLTSADQAEIRVLLESKKETLEQLLQDYDAYSNELAELHTTELQLIAETESYADFIAERVLWIRSCSALSRADVRPVVGALAWSLDPRNWRDAGAAVIEAAGRQPAQFALAAIGLAALAATQRACRRRLQALGADAAKRSCTRLRPTFHALWLTAVLALPWPGLLALVGWYMDNLSESEFVRSLSASLRFTAVCLLLMELSRHLCRPGGLAEAHFEWPQARLLCLRRKLRWLTVLGLPLVLWLVGLEVQGVEPLWSSSLGRICFIAAMLLLAAMLQRLLLARNSPYRQLVLVGGGGWLTPLQLTWRPAVMLLPTALAVLAAVGYYYTAQQAAVRILQSVGLLLAVLALGGLTRRWLLVNHRRLAREQAKQRRAQLAAAAETDASAPLPAELAEEAIDLAAVSEQTQKLVRTFLSLTTTIGLALIWIEILPAIAYRTSHKLPFAEQLTWGSLLIFAVILAVTYASVRGIPALLELVVLQHLPLDSGSRYAITSVSRYLLTAVGLVAAFNSIGGNWAQIQWLVAAMSVGLGFGLQEIFANFVSGIILLFERPIRVGDVVTLADKTGVVSRIRMRATTIIDPDRKEYIVPNKDLVTGRLLNWTLTDFTNRIEIAVNVASGSDTDLACDLLLEAAREQSTILAEPSPSAAFEGFVENGLKLVLRCFLPNLDSRGATIHALHTAIDRKFRAAGIEGPHGDMRIRLARSVPASTFRPALPPSEASAQVPGAKSSAA
jgi:potassium efflux system protein